MRQPKGSHFHTYAPAIWRRTPNITGDYEMDASICHCKNKSVPSKLGMYISGDGPGYGPLSGYNAYHNYHGDT